MGAFGWGELISLVAVLISFATICVSLLGNSKLDTKNEQKMFDKLDNLSSLSQETRDTVRDISTKLEDHSERISRIEGDIKTLYNRVERIENTCDAHLYKRPSNVD